MEMYLKPIAKGALTFLPGVPRVLNMVGTGGTNSAEYCYDLWLKHVTLLWENGMRTEPTTVAELGPGDSLGTGLAAVLSGADRYFALDIVAHSNPESTLTVFEDLVELFRSRAPRPRSGWPNFDAYLAEDLFPHHILTEERLERSTTPERVANS